MTILAFAIYAGGAAAVEEAGWGWWRTIVWPYYLGRWLGHRIAAEAGE